MHQSCSIVDYFRIVSSNDEDSVVNIISSSTICVEKKEKRKTVITGNGNLITMIKTIMT